MELLWCVDGSGVGHGFKGGSRVSICGRAQYVACERIHPRQVYCCCECRDGGYALPVEARSSFTDIGHPLYEWIVTGHCWSVDVMSHYLRPLD